MAAVASPSKQLKMEPPAIPQQAPDDPRRSFARVASQHEHANSIQQRAREGRAAVARGQAGASTIPATRQLGPTRSEPNISFSNLPPQPPRGLANSHQEIMDAVHSSGGSRREIQPMYEMGSPTSSVGAGGQLLSDRDGYFRRVPTIDAAMQDDDDDADGFDVDDVFGSPAKMLNFDNPESQLDGASTSTSTGNGAGLKRAFTEDESEGADEDEEMAKTDEEDEGDEGEGVAPLGTGRQLFANMPSRSGLARTQSLPAAVFNGAEDF